MSAAGTRAQKALKQALADRRFDPVYYFHGEDDFLKDQAVRRVVEAAVDPATRDFNLEIRRASELDAESVESLLGTPPMMAERRVVVFRDVAALKKDARTALDRYLARPASDTVLVLVAPAGAKPDAKLQERTTEVEFDGLTGAQLPKWIEQYAERELGAAITAPAVALLQTAVGSDLPALAAELDKLASYANGAPIDEDAVSAIVGVRRGETLGDLLDLIAQRDAMGALAILEHVLQQQKTTGVYVVMMLTAQMLAIAWGRARRDAGMPLNRLAQDYFGFLKENRHVYPGRPWGEAASAWTKAVPAWTLPELDRALQALLLADLTLKESRLSSEEQVLATLILELCGAPRRRAAA
jgi:DNA polymerase III subunit delta